VIFEGGYAPVIQPADYPVPSAGPGRRPDSGQPPYPGRPGGPGWPATGARAADQDVFVYRDDSEPAPKPSARARSADDAAYWYDPLTEDPAPPPAHTRGPFEPLVSSSDPPGGGREQAGETGQAQGPAGEGSTDEAGRIRKLEQLKDLYLTAQAIGEQNVDKHFDQLMAQQRQLISDYFGPSGTAAPAMASPRDGEAEPPLPGGEVTPPEGLAVWAEPPRAW
jgi:hypothetical protein